MNSLPSIFKFEQKQFEFLQELQAAQSAQEDPYFEYGFAEFPSSTLGGGISKTKKRGRERNGNSDEEGVGAPLTKRLSLGLRFVSFGFFYSRKEGH